MAPTDAHPTPTHSNANLYVSELRFGIVMYGGVSLAIYINGVANELYEMALATPLGGGDSDVTGTRQVYAWLSYLLGDEALLGQCREHLKNGGALAEFFVDRTEALRDAPRTRLVVDVISGTSAGGINGIFLAKALANNESFGLLKDLWIHEGDIGLLLNDKGSRFGANSGSDNERRPVSLLDSNRMYAKLHAALTAMSSSRDDGLHRSSVVDELDLFVTTTDIGGATVGLRLFDRVVFERRHKQVIKLRYRADDSEDDEHNDFEDANLSFLAYAGRCTSSFPFAFEPMTLAAVGRGGGTVRDGDTQRWSELFAGRRSDEDGYDPLKRPYGDGGYLDNKPFSHAVQALAERESVIPVERKLIYIEPSPEHPQDEDRVARAAGTLDRAPDPIRNALAATGSIPRRETIREDLEAVLARNRLIERVEYIIEKGERDLDAHEQSDPYMRELGRTGAETDFSSMKFDDMRRYYGDAFMPYRRLRVYMVTDELADYLAQQWSVDLTSDRRYALRALVRVWRDRHYDGDALGAAPERPTFNQYLGDFDLGYRLRRVRFMVRRIDVLYRLLRKHGSGGLAEPVAGLSEQHHALLERLKRAGLDLETDVGADFNIVQGMRALSYLRQALLAARRSALRRSRIRRCAAEAPITPGRQELRNWLMPTLDLLLDTDDKSVQHTHGRADAQRLANLLPAEVVDSLAQHEKLPSSTRTLQERVYERARVLYDSLLAHQATDLQSALEADIECFRASVAEACRGNGTQPGLSEIGTLLGDPKWEFADTGASTSPVGEPARTAYVVVGDTGHPILDAPIAKLLRRLLGAYYLRHDSYDQMSLPLYYSSNVGEPAKVEVFRVSPEDAISLINERCDPRGRRKLAGTTLANFGGFLDEAWRRNDIMWGRLDGAERLIDALLPQNENAEVRAALRMQAHEAIVQEELSPSERTAVTKLMMAALDEAGAEAAKAGRDNYNRQRQHALLSALKLGDSGRRKAVETALERLFEPVGLLDFIRTSRDVDRRLEPQRILSHAARAVSVTGRILEGVSVNKKVDALPRWIARAGLLTQSLVAVSIPGQSLALFTRYWLTLLYIFAGLTFLLGMIFSVPEMRSAAVSAVLLLGAFHVTTVALGDVMRERPPWQSTATWLVVIAVMALAAVGAWSVYVNAGRWYYRLMSFIG